MPLKILFLGDVVGRGGRDMVSEHLPELIKKYQVDFALVNADNASSGFGVNKAHSTEFFRVGADCLTGGNHIWDCRNVSEMLEEFPTLLRPHNYPEKCPGSGVTLLEKNGKKLLVIHLLGQVFMHENVNCPFESADKILRSYKIGGNVDAIFVDIHCEANSEKAGLAYYLDGRVTAVIGSHTHIPTDDARILPKGTAFMSDAGMCGDYNSIIGYDIKEPISRFVNKTRSEKLIPMIENPILRGALIESKLADGLAENNITPIKIE